MFQQINVKQEDPQVAENQEMDVSSSGKAEFARCLAYEFGGSRA